MPFDAHERERAGTKKVFWQSLGLFVTFTGLTVMSYLRPEWLQMVLTIGAFLSLIFVAMGAQEMWRLRRSNPFP